MVREAEVVRAGVQIQNDTWAVDRVRESERAEAAAILEAAVSRWVVSQRNSGMFTRWLCDDEVCMLLLLLSGFDANVCLRKRAAESMTACGASRLQG